MNGFFAALQRFGLGRLAAFAGIGVGIAAALGALFMNMGRPNALLYSNLDLKEAGEITRALDQANIRYEAKGDGSTLMVARDEVATTRLLLSGKGLPTAGSVGYELFDQTSVVGQTDFVQQLNRQRALEGELERGEGTGEDAGEVEDADVGEGLVHWAGSIGGREEDLGSAQTRQGPSPWTL